MASLDVKSSHKVRKTVFSNLFAKGFDFEEIMQISGHHNKETLINHYLYSLKTPDDRQERISNALATNCCKIGQPKVNQIENAIKKEVL